MKAKQKHLFIFLSILLAFTSCSSDEYIQPIGEGEKLAILGETNANDSVRIELLYLKNRVDTIEQIPLSNNAEVRIVGKQKNIELNRREDFEWSSYQKLKEDEHYHLEVLEDKKTTKIPLYIPSHFILEVVKKNSESLNKQLISVNISDEEMASSFYTISCITNDSTFTNQQYLFLTSNSRETDNYIFNELDTPCKTLFLNKKSKTVSLDITLSNEVCELLIKRCNSEYYSYLYAQEVQNTNEQIIGIQNTQDQYLGMWGGVFLKKVSIK